MFDRSIDWLVKHPRLFKVVNPVVSLFICTCAKHTMRRCFVSLVLAFSIVIAAAAIGNWLATVLAVVLCLRYIKEGSKAAQEFRASPWRTSATSLTSCVLPCPRSSTTGSTRNLRGRCD